MGGIKGGVGGFLLRRSAAKSIRQRHQTGPQYNRRKVFPEFQRRRNDTQRHSFSNFGGGNTRNSGSSTHHKHFHQLHRRDAPGRQLASPTHQPEYMHHAHLSGDVRTLPEKDYTFGVYVPRKEGEGVDVDTLRPHELRYVKERADKLLYSWQPQGRLSLHKVQKRETFVCYYCGYPTKSSLVAVLDDNWDYRMCYRCYNNVRRQGLEHDPS